MANFNKVMLLGNLTADPEVRYTPRGTAVTDIRMAINRVWNDDQNQRKEETTYLDVTLWGRQAEIAGQYLNKGRPVLIEGRLQMDSAASLKSSVKTYSFSEAEEVLAAAEIAAVAVETTAVEMVAVEMVATTDTMPHPVEVLQPQPISPESKRTTISRFNRPLNLFGFS